MMQLEKLFRLQRALDGHIEEKHQLQNEDLFNRKVLALLVEVGELANETRCFKFWSMKPASPKAVILEEFVDGVHFILSLGIECGFDKSEWRLDETSPGLQVTEQFLLVNELIHLFQKSKSLNDYSQLFSAYLQLASLFGFTYEEIELAYVSKNEVNYERQENNY